MGRLGRGRAAVAALAAGALAWGAVAGVAGAGGDAAPARASAVLRDVSGDMVGTVNVAGRRAGGLTVRVDVRGQTPGFHGLHLHATGVCEAPSAGADGATGPFLSAGGHVGTPDQRHGGHSGDLPPLRVGGDGTAQQTAQTDALSVPELLADDGTAVIVHAGPDNLGHIPPRYSAGGAPGPDAETLRTGDAGGRAACGVLRAGRIAPGLPPSYRIPGDDVFPEGIAVDRPRKAFFVSSTSDGTIFRGTAGDEDLVPFLSGGADGRTTAIGVAVDSRRHRLFVAGGATGRIFVYDTRDGDLIARFATGTGGFVNDVAVAPDGTAYATDSFRPVLFRIEPRRLRGRSEALVRLPAFRRVAREIPHRDGFNLNGIEVGNGGRALVLAQGNTGRLYRMDLGTGEIERIDLSARVRNADGLVLTGRTLYVVRNFDQAIAEVRLSRDLRRGRLVGTTRHPSFDVPTTADVLGGRLLVVNSQFDARETEPGPTLPFTVSAIPRP